MTDAVPRHLYLIDGSAYIFRAFFALPPMTRSDGTPTNAVMGFSSMILNLIEQTDADYVAVIFDAKRENFRNEIYPDYKGHRPDAPEELRPQFSLIRDATEAFNLPCLEMEGYEADDLIATYAKQAVAKGSKVTIVSSDKDLMQLVQDGIEMWDPMKNTAIHHDQVVEKFGVPPEKVVDVQALAGDSTDNVPGVPGIGIKTAAQLIVDYGDLDTLLERAGEIKQPKRRENLIEHAELARISRELVRLKQDVPVEVPLEELKRRPLDNDRLLEFLKLMEFKRLIARFQTEEAAQEASEAAAAPAETDYQLVQDEAALKAWIDAAYKTGILAVDTETTGLDAMQADLVGICLSTEPGKACYIPLGHVGEGEGDLLSSGDAEAPKQIPMATALDLLRPVLADPSVLKVGQNLKYDLQILGRLDVPVTPIDDTMLMSFCVDGGAHGHGMDELADLHLGMKTIKFEEVCGKGKNQITFDKVPLDKALAYAAEDADITLRLHRALKPRLLADRMTTLYETIERPLAQILADMERAGIKVDPKTLKEMSADFAKRIADLEAEIHKDAGQEFNVASPKQLGEILFDKLGLKGGKKTKSGGYSTDSGVLEPLALDNPIVQKVLDFRGLSKLKSTYTDALVEDINPQTKRVHTSYSMVGAQTGRLSSTDPNLQNIPIRTAEGRRIREAFIAEPGCKLISLDYSQIELRLVAEIADLDALKQAFQDGLDIHAMTASEVFGVPLKEMDSETRRKAKAINFGIIYGISAFGLANQIGVSRTEAKDFIDRYFERFPGIRKFMDETVEGCREKGYVETLFGRRIHLGGINDKNPMRRGYAERQAINAPIQGTAADIIKRAMIRIPGALAEAGLDDVTMLLQVHDELIFEAPADKAEKAVPVIRDVMEGAAGPARTLSVPLEVEAGIADNWREAH
ncbi:DNA polymerase I [Hwanghaeella grinnelliae]|uniref:DNA polymerase I n=1 Tax=Hwanghaeella grinnelliae TaxID=2500179 RepID=A0A437QPE5_9PROT|nr:DNA polymerase I [Hwanghaeella grinnelliae]RVU36360.1 DNA polymerase I [Hwanghaeella grinnelliae]